MKRNPSRERGFALLVVLWTLGFLALIGTQILTEARQGTLLAGYLLDAAAVESASNGAVQQAIFNLLDDSDRHWSADGATHTIRIGRALIAVRIDQESDKVNPNYASAALLQALLVQVGVNQATAASVAQSIIEWRMAGGAPGHPDATTVGYIAAGRDYVPSGAPFTSLDELDAVLGMTPDLLVRLRPHLSIYTDGDPDPATHDLVVARALAAAGEHGGAADAGGPSQVVSVTADARGNGDARFAIQVVVRTNGRPEGRRFDVLAYHRLFGPPS
jgi:general secretion pathway protein K